MGRQPFGPEIPGVVGGSGAPQMQWDAGQLGIGALQFRLHHSSYPTEAQTSLLARQLDGSELSGVVGGSGAPQIQWDAGQYGFGALQFRLHHSSYPAAAQTSLLARQLDGPELSGVVGGFGWTVVGGGFVGGFGGMVL